MNKKLKLIGFLLASFSAGLNLSYGAYGSAIMSATTPESTAEYISMYNADNVTHEVGDVVVFGTNSTYGIAITTITTANYSRVAGVIAGQDCASGQICLVKTHGYDGAVTVSVATTAGDALVTSTTGEAAGVYSISQATGTAAGEAVSAGVFAIALESTTSSTTVKAFLLR